MSANIDAMEDSAVATEEGEFEDDLERLTDEYNSDESDNSDTDDEDRENIICQQIETEIDKPYTDQGVLKSICEGSEVPAKIRGKLWTFLLGVDRKPNVLGNWKPEFAELKTAALLKAECRSEAEKLADWGCEVEDSANDMETVLSFYCNTRSCQYRPGWAEIVRPLLTLNLPLWRVFNCFYAIIEKFIPHPQGNQAKIPYQLFRMLLQYHDPELSHFMDSKRVDPRSYLYSWLRSLFSHAVDTAVALALWDVYLLEGNTLLVYFMSLSLLVNQREALLKLESTAEIEALLPSMPSPITPEDAEDFISVARHFYSITPHSIRTRDLHRALFVPYPRPHTPTPTRQTNGSTEQESGSKNGGRNSGGTDKKESESGGQGTGALGADGTAGHRPRSPRRSVMCLSDSMCLSVASTEICQGQISKKNSGTESAPLPYIVLDVRSAQDLQQGRLPTAIHVDVDLLMENPDEFHKRMAMFGEMGDEHICVYGSSTEESNTRMVISYFLQRNIKHVSCLSGGYRAIHDLFKETGFVEIADHNAEACTVCNPNAIASPSPDSRSHSRTFSFDSIRASLRRKSDVPLAKAMLKDDKESEKPPVSVKANESWSSFFQRGKQTLSNIGKDKNGDTHVQTSRQSSVASNRGPFGIGGSDEDSDGSDVEGENLNSMRKINIEDNMDDIGAISSFQCEEMAPRNRRIASVLVVSESAFYVLRTPAQTHPVAYVKESFPLWTLTKITANKKDADLLTFVFKIERDGIQTTQPRRFLLKNSRTVSQTIGKLVLANVRQRQRRHTLPLQEYMQNVQSVSAKGDTHSQEVAGTSQSAPIENGDKPQHDISEEDNATIPSVVDQRATGDMQLPSHSIGSDED